jgi:hypothetical protein
VLPRLLATGVLCQIDEVLLEYHDGSTAHADIARRYGATQKFPSTLAWIIQQAGTRP